MDISTDIQSNKRSRNISSSNNCNDDYEAIIHNINELNIHSNHTILKNILKKIEKLEKKFEDIDKIHSKLNDMEKNMNKILNEKDYIIENLKDEVSSLKWEIREKSDSDHSHSKSINDYFY
jgi:chromosome segregation ATPase